LTVKEEIGKRLNEDAPLPPSISERKEKRTSEKEKDQIRDTPSLLF